MILDRVCDGHRLTLIDCEIVGPKALTGIAYFGPGLQQSHRVGDLAFKIPSRFRELATFAVAYNLELDLEQTTVVSPSR